MKTSEAIAHFGTASKLAAALGINRAAVSQWGAVVPKGRAYELQDKTRGALRVDEALYATARVGD